MKKSRVLKLLTFIVAVAIIFFIGLNIAKGALFEKTNTYYAYFPHSGGLKAGTQITENGVKVGNVESVDLEQETGKIKVTMQCADKYKFSKNSVAELYNSLLGGAGLQILPAFDNAPVIESEGEFQARIQEDMLASISSSIKPTQEKLNRLLNQADTTLTGVNKILDVQTTSELKGAIAELSATMRNLNKASVTLNNMLIANQTNLQATLQNANKMTAELAKLSSELSSTELNKTIADAQKTLANLNTLLASVESGNGTIGKLLKDEALYKDLDKSAKQLELLLEDFRLNPKRYVHFSVFGKKAKTYEPQDEQKAK